MHESRLTRRLARYEGDFDLTDRYALKCCGGSGGSGEASQEERDLYAAQAEQVRLTSGLAKEYLPGATSQFVGSVNRYFDPAYEQRMVGQANVDAQGAISRSNQAMTRGMARYGLNPASGRWGSMVNQGAIQGAATLAGASNKARQDVQDKQFGASKDLYSAMVGLPSDSARMAGQAAAGYNSMTQNAAQAQNNNMMGWGNMLGMGANAYTTFMKDGGEVRMASGGLLGGGGGLTPRVPMPARHAPGPTDMQQAAQVGNMGLTGYKAGQGMVNGVPKLAGALGDKLATTNMSELGVGLQNMSFGADAATGALPAAAEAAAGTAAAETAGAAGAAAGESSLAALGTAMPWVGAALAIGAIFDMFAAGGEVTDVDDESKFTAQKNIFEALFGEEYTGAPEQIALVQQFVSKAVPASDNSDMEQAIRGDVANMQQGGGVAGPGTETSDSVPAKLSTGEFVVNAEAVKMPGVKPMLEKVNAAGLRKRQGYAKGGHVKKGC